MLAEALETEMEGFLSQYRDLRDGQDRQRVVRNVYFPEREIETGIGPVEVKVPHARDRQPCHESEPIRFTSALLARYLQKTRMNVQHRMSNEKANIQQGEGCKSLGEGTEALGITRMSGLV
ncbi:MAG: hypothetical protein SV775_13365 [Thermodesulfobacteriota bacterium]|nr:hypothetical protein [Thermodesulfobacteriota bacterium]